MSQDDTDDKKTEAFSEFVENSQEISKDISEKVDKALTTGDINSVARFLLSSSTAWIPIGGSIVGAASSSWSEAEQSWLNNLLASWLKLHEEELKEICQTMFEIMVRLDHADPNVKTRVESKEYLSLVRKAFRDWSAAESETKRRLIRNLLANAASTRICGDDVITMFITWIERYSEAHFKIIASVYNNKGITRQGIWEDTDGKDVREDSAEADLFKLLIDELSQGRIIRQHREKDYNGNYIKSSPRPRNSTNSSSYMTSAFDGNKQYELTELGKQFVHYTMNEIVKKVEAPTGQDSTPGTPAGEEDFH